MIDPKHFNHPEDDYYFEDALRDAVRVAHDLQRPLLLAGLPGTGKTTAARAICKVLERHAEPPVMYHRFNTKSTSVYTDLLYTYDHLGHFLQVQLGNPNAKIEDHIPEQALGKAIIESHNQASLVLIDEIDKAPRDFPNDLLDTLDESSFTIKERRMDYKVGEHRPFIVLTSNAEKALPDAFLRRCIFFYIEFPDGEQLRHILQRHIDKDYLKKHLETLESWIKEVQVQLPRKKIGTAELIQWIRFLQKEGFDSAQLRPDQSAQAETLRMSLSILAKTKEDFEYLQRHCFPKA
ncbi:MAG: AAA family ATPase [Bernardetiaceae bacterium]